jgi:hypothetical protein
MKARKRNDGAISENFHPSHKDVLAALDHFFLAFVPTQTMDADKERETKFLSLLKEHSPSEEVLRNTCALLEMAITSFPSSQYIQALVNDILIQNQQNCDYVLDLCKDLEHICRLSVGYAHGKKTTAKTEHFNAERYPSTLSDFFLIKK